jgi:pimeloyl-ACP methyl ester carboxylesterase
MPYIDVAGESTYFETWGSGVPLVLLHGGYCSLEVMRELAELLAERFEVHAPERAGHGRTADREGPYSYARMAADTVAYLDAAGIARAHVVGFSDGAITSLLLARDHGDRVLSIVPISGNLSTDAYVADDYPHPTMTEEAHAIVGREYADLSPDGSEHAAVVLEKLGALWTIEPDIPAESLASVTAPALVLAGEHDVIRRDHTEAVAAALHGARVEIVDGTTHLLVREKPAEVAAHILAFLDGGRA